MYICIYIKENGVMGLSLYLVKGAFADVLKVFWKR